MADVVPPVDVLDDSPGLLGPALDELDGAGELTDGGGLASGSLIELGGGDDGGGIVEGDASCHALLVPLVALLLKLLFIGELESGADEFAEGGGEYAELPVGGVGGTNRGALPRMGNGGVRSISTDE